MISSKQQGLSSTPEPSALAVLSPVRTGTTDTIMEHWQAPTVLHGGKNPEGPDDGIRVGRAVRTNLLLSGSIEANNISSPVRIRNLSETGALLEGAALPKVGEHLVLCRLQLKIGGTVTWSAKSRCGVKFDGMISVAGWRVGTWIAPVPTDGQSRVDAIQAAVRSGTLDASHYGSAIEQQPGAIEVDLDVRIADELADIRRMLEVINDRLSGDPVIVEHHHQSLQNIDTAVQILNHLTTILSSKDRSRAIDKIGMDSLQRRLR